MSFLRLLLVILRARLAPALGPLAWSVLRLRVWPSDLDLNLHMNNGRYLTLMDLGRLDLLLRNRLYQKARRQRWMPLVGSAMIRYRRSLQPLQAFELHTRLLGWDDRWFVFEQRFVRAGQVCALSLVRALFRGAHGNISPAETLRVIGVEADSRPLPDYVRGWAEADADAYASLSGSSGSG